MQHITPLTAVRGEIKNARIQKAPAFNYNPFHHSSDRLNASRDGQPVPKSNLDRLSQVAYFTIALLAKHVTRKNFHFGFVCLL